MADREDQETVLVVNDLDGDAVQTIAMGTEGEVRAVFGTDHPVQAIITEALANGRSQATYNLCGETFSTRVLVQR